MLHFVVSDRRTPPNLFMSCSRIMYGQCSRCGAVSKTHFERGWAPNSQEQERKQIQHAFFQKKTKFSTPKAQLRMFHA